MACLEPSEAETIDTFPLLTVESLSSSEVGFVLKLLHRAHLPEGSSESARQQCAIQLDISLDDMKRVAHRSVNAVAKEMKPSKPSQRPSMFSKKPFKAATAAATTGGMLLAFVVTTPSEKAAKEMAERISLQIASLLDPLVFGKVVLEGDVLLSMKHEAYESHEYKEESDETRSLNESAAAAAPDAMPAAAEELSLDATEQEAQDDEKQKVQDQKTAASLKIDGAQSQDIDPLSPLSTSRTSAESTNLLDEDEYEDENLGGISDVLGTPKANHSKEPLDVNLDTGIQDDGRIHSPSQSMSDAAEHAAAAPMKPEVFDWTTELSLAMDRKMTYLRSTLPAYDRQAPRHLRVGPNASILGEAELLDQPLGSSTSSNSIIVALLLAAGMFSPARSAKEATAITEAAALHRQQVVGMLRRHMHRYAPSVLALRSLEGEGTMRASKWLSGDDDNGGNQISARLNDQNGRESGVETFMTAPERAQYDARCLALTAAPSGASAAFRNAEFQASADVLGAAVVVDTIVVRTGATSRVVFEPWPEARFNNGNDSSTTINNINGQDRNAKSARLLICKCALNPTTVEAVLPPAPKKRNTTEKEFAPMKASVATEEGKVVPLINTSTSKAMAAEKAVAESGGQAGSSSGSNRSSDSNALTTGDDDKWAFDRLKMTALYEVHDSSKVSSVEALLIKYDGKRAAMWGKLQEKFGEAATDAATAEAHQRLAALAPFASTPDSVPKHKGNEDAVVECVAAKSPKPTSPSVKKTKKTKPIEVKQIEPERPHKFRNNLEKKKFEEEEARLKMKLDFEKRLAAKKKAKPSSPNAKTSSTMNQAGSSAGVVLDPATAKRQAKKAVEAAKAAADASAQKATRFRRIANKAKVDVEHAGVVSTSAKSQALRVKAAEAADDAQLADEDARLLAEKAAELADFVMKNGKLPSSNAPPPVVVSASQTTQKSFKTAGTSSAPPPDPVSLEQTEQTASSSNSNNIGGWWGRHRNTPEVEPRPSTVDLSDAHNKSAGLLEAPTRIEHPNQVTKGQEGSEGALGQDKPNAGAGAASVVGSPSPNDASEQPAVDATRSGPGPLSRLWRGNKRDNQSSSSSSGNSNSNGSSSSSSKSSSNRSNSKSTKATKQSQIKERMKEAKKRAEEEQTLKAMASQAQAEVAAELAAFGGVWPLSAFDVTTGLPLPKHLRGALVPTHAASKHSTPSQLAASAQIVDRLLKTLASEPPPPPEMGVLWFVPDPIAPWRSSQHRQLEARFNSALAANKYHRLKAKMRAQALQEQQQQQQQLDSGSVSLFQPSPYADNISSSSSSAPPLTPLFHLPKRKQSWAEYMAQGPANNQALTCSRGSAESGDYDTSRSRDRDNRYNLAGLGTAI